MKIVLHEKNGQLKEIGNEVTNKLIQNIDYLKLLKLLKFIKNPDKEKLLHIGGEKINVKDLYSIEFVVDSPDKSSNAAEKK